MSNFIRRRLSLVFIGTILACGGSGSGSGNESDAPPVDELDAVDDMATTADEHEVIAGNVLANDNLGLGLESIELVTDVTEGTLIFDTSSGDWSYDPGELFNALNQGDSSTQLFSYRLTDTSGESDTAQVVVTITGTNDSPGLTYNDDATADSTFDKNSEAIAALADGDSIGDRVRVRLSPGEQIDLTMQFTRPAAPGPLEILFIQDAGGSVVPYIEDILYSWGRTSSPLQGLSPSVRLGLATTIDKPLENLPSTQDDWVYQLHTPLSFFPAMNGLGLQQTLVNLGYGDDVVEAQLEALMIGAQDSQVGYRKGATRFVVVVTDAGYHLEGDLAFRYDRIGETPSSPIVPNNGDVMSDYFEDYPSMDQVRDVLYQENTVPLFAILRGPTVSNYSNLTEYWELGDATYIPFDNGSTYLLEMFENSFATYRPRLLGNSETLVDLLPTAGFEGVSIGQTVDFTISFVGQTNPGLETVEFVVPGHGRVIFDIETQAVNPGTHTYVGGPAVEGTTTTIDPDTGATFAYTLQQGPADGTVTLNADGSFVYRPDTGFDDLGVDETRLVSFSYIATDEHGAASAPINVELLVGGGNHAPVAQDDVFAIDMNFTTTGDVLADNGNGVDADPNPADVLTVELVDDVDHGELELNSDGTFVFTPPINTTGTVTFRYEVSDGQGNTSRAQVTIDISPITGFVEHFYESDTFLTDGAEHVVGTANDDYLDPQGGVQTVYLDGGPGNDTFYLDGVRHYIRGGEGADEFTLEISGVEQFFRFLDFNVAEDSFAPLPSGWGSRTVVNETSDGVLVYINNDYFEFAGLTAADLSSIN